VVLPRCGLELRLRKSVAHRKSVTKNKFSHFWQKKGEEEGGGREKGARDFAREGCAKRVCASPPPRRKGRGGITSSTDSDFSKFEQNILWILIISPPAQPGHARPYSSTAHPHLMFMCGHRSACICTMARSMRTLLVLRRAPLVCMPLLIPAPGAVAQPVIRYRAALGPGYWDLAPA
jgi:hypothetical protein